MSSEAIFEKKKPLQVCAFLLILIKDAGGGPDLQLLLWKYSLGQESAPRHKEKIKIKKSNKHKLRGR